jgi:hypothetical protein
MPVGLSTSPLCLSTPLHPAAPRQRAARPAVNPRGLPRHVTTAAAAQESEDDVCCVAEQPAAGLRAGAREHRARARPGTYAPPVRRVVSTSCRREDLFRCACYPSGVRCAPRAAARDSPVATCPPHPRAGALGGRRVDFGGPTVLQGTWSETEGTGKDRRSGQGPAVRFGMAAACVLRRPWCGGEELPGKRGCPAASRISDTRREE